MMARLGAWVSSVGGAFVLLLSCLLLFELSALDLALQDTFYDAATKTWLVDWKNPLGRFAFYHAPKVVVILVGLVAVVLALCSRAWIERRGFQRRGLIAGVLTLVTVPLLVGGCKRWLDVPCPYDLQRYGGTEVYAKLCGCKPRGPNDPGAGCFPAGHASGGFALLGFLAARRGRSWRRTVIVAGSSAGAWMGGFQMLRGAHFLSHTVVTGLFTWLVVRCLCAALRAEEGEDSEVAAA